MHRALLIELGETFEEPFVRLRERLSERVSRGEVAFFDAPVVGDGNLSRPVESLKRSLDDELSDLLAGLLTFAPDARSEVLLDVFICVNAGERRTIEAMTEISLTLLALIERDYGAVFPAHRQGLQRGLRLFPVVILPHGRTAERPRDEAVAAVAGFAVQCDDFETTTRESPVDRIFILDGVTSRGIASPESLTAQAEAFLTVASDADFRDGPDMADALDRSCEHRGATLGAACFTVPYDTLHHDVARRVCDELLASFEMLPRESLRLPSPEQLVPSFAVLRDDALERALEQIERHLHRAYETYGLPGIEGAVADLAEIEKRLAAWRSAGLTQRNHDEEPSEIATVRQETSPRSYAAAGSILFGLMMVALAHLVFGLTIVASAGISLFFAVAAMATALLLISLSENKAKEAAEVDRAERLQVTQPPEDALTPDQRLDLLTSAAASERTRGRRFIDALTALNPEVPRLPNSAAKPWRWAVGTSTLAPIVHDAVRDYSDPEELRRSFEAELPPLETLLDGVESIDDETVVGHCLRRTARAARPDVMHHHAVRDALLAEFEQFIGTWQHGVEPFLDLARDRHFESTSRLPVRNGVFADEHLGADVDEMTSTKEGPFQRCARSSDFCDVVVLSIQCDLPLGSLASFAPYLDEDER